MSCSDYSDAIAEFVDGTLDPAKQRALERHVEGCEACRALVADLRSIQAAAFTLDRHEPPSHVLETLRSRDCVRSAARGSQPIVGLAGLADHVGWLGRRRRARGGDVAGHLAAGSEIPIRTRMPPPQVSSEAPGDPVASVVTELEAAEDHYDKAIQGLEQIAKSDSGALDPQVAAVLQKNLQVIDQAIGESRAALKAQPASPDAQESLFDAMRSKVALLQQTVELINEMRKGNQAEAGRLIQGLNQ